MPLGRVSHVAHVPTAVRIAEDGRLRADLVFDESKLNKRRIRVVWLSPNDWDNAGGFRYGNVRFNFDWATLVADKNYYWVEDIAYGVPACRILVTDVDRSKTLDEYDPTLGDGPWWLDSSGEHQWNGEYCLEVMFEGDLDVEQAIDVDFVTHHPKRCSIDYKTCTYCGIERWTGGAEFIATLVSRKATLAVPGLIETKKKTSKASFDLEAASMKLLFKCRKLKVKNWGDVNHSDAAALPLARAVLGALGNADIADDARALAAHFASSDDLERAVANAIATAVGLPDSSSLIDED
jgi:hypothetical protein